MSRRDEILNRLAGLRDADLAQVVAAVESASAFGDGWIQRSPTGALRARDARNVVLHERGCPPSELTAQSIDAAAAVQVAERRYLFEARFRAEVETVVQLIDQDLRRTKGARLEPDDRSVATLAAAVALSRPRPWIP